MNNENDIKLGVSLYSYQDNYYFQKHDLEGCLAAAAGAGATGVEVFPDQMIQEWPYISDAFADRWYGLMERYGLETICVDHFSDRAMWHDRQLTDDEMYERGVMYIKAAAKLGAGSIRLLHENHIGKNIFPYKLTTPEITERLLPVAAEYNVMMALECHAPTHVGDPVHEPYLEAAERLNLPFVGLQADFSSYEFGLSHADVIEFTSYGCTEEIFSFVRLQQKQAYLDGRDFILDEIKAEVEKMNPNAQDRKYLRMENKGTMNGYKIMGDTAYPRYDILKDYASKIVYVHGKFHYIDEEGEVDNMDYHKIFQALKEGGYKGYVSSEFEGNRRMNMVGWVDEIEFVRKHHLLMRKCLVE